jgi:Tol biopolymer transport system component
MFRDLFYLKHLTKMKIIYLLFSVSITSLYAQLPSLSEPPEKVSLFGEGTVSTLMNERDFAISPDGTEIYFTISTPKSSFQTIVFCKKTEQGGWTSPTVVSFAGMFSDLEPAFSADGQTLYFVSNRPTTGTERKDFDIWKVTRSSSGWNAPVNVGSPINTEEDEFYPSITNSGNLYYTAAYAGGTGKEDIYVAKWKNNQYQQPIALDTAVNSRFYEFNAFVAPNEQYILFTSYGRKDDAGGGDLYMSNKDAKGNWLPAKNMKNINSNQLDYCPYVSPDGKSLFFTSERHSLPSSFTDSSGTYKAVLDSWTNALNGNGDVYWIHFESIKKMLEK